MPSGTRQARNSGITQEDVKRLFTYKRGHLYWKPRPPEAFANPTAYVMWNKRYAHTKAGCKNNRGYIRIGIEKRYYFAHRLIWLYHKGYLPKLLDHINGKTDDNRMGNLRAATQMENRWNSRRKQPTKSNIKGVYKRAEGVYEAHICSDHKRYYIGRFVRKSDAERAVREYRRDLHKEFARNG
jgi:hypothetical protein